MQAATNGGGSASGKAALSFGACTSRCDSAWPHQCVPGSERSESARGTESVCSMDLHAPNRRGSMSALVCESAHEYCHRDRRTAGSLRMHERVVVAPAADQATDSTRLMRGGPRCERLRMGRECERQGRRVFASRSALRITGMFGLLASRTGDTSSGRVPLKQIVSNHMCE